MANAMLAGEFKSSHPDLTKMEEEGEEPEMDRTRGENTSNTEERFTRGTTNRCNHLEAQAPLLEQPQQPQDDGESSTFVVSAKNNGSVLPSSNTTSNHNHSQSSYSRTAAMSSRKSVDFAIQPPASKRSRQEVPWTAKQVVDAISTSITRHERWEAIQNAKDSFNHDVQAVHDDEIATGVDAALAKHLTFLVFHEQQLRKNPNMTLSGNSHVNSTSHDDHESAQESIMTEISMTCDAMESLYRASSNVVGSSFERMGRELVCLMVTLIGDELQRRQRAVQHMPQRRCRPSMDDDDPTHDQRTAPSTNELNDGDGLDDTSSNNRITPKQDQVGNMHTTNDRGNEANAIRLEGVSADLNESGKEDSGKQSRSTTERFGQDESERQSRRPITPPGIQEILVHPGTPEGDLLLRKATKILGHFARVGSATKPLAHFPGLLGSLIHLITLRPYDCVPWEARLSALWTIANLACNSDNMQMMVCTPSLVGALVEIACRALHPGDPLEVTMEVLRSRSIAARAILNLSWAPENKIILAEHAALIDLLSELTVHRTAPLNQSRTVREILVATRRHSVGALRNLLAAPRRVKIGLCEYKNGRILDILTDAALNDSDVAVRDGAFAAIHNLATQDTASMIASHPALVLALKDALLSEEDSAAAAGSGDTSSGVGTPKSHASATLMVLERSIPPGSKSYANLRDLLDALNPALTSDVGESGDEQDMIHTMAV